MTVKERLVEILEKKPDKPMYGIFFDGKLLLITRKRIYLQAGRAKAELVGQNYSWATRDVPRNPNSNYTTDWRERRQLAKDAVDELIKEGRLEIKQI